jgi:hypothetical protein
MSLHSIRLATVLGLILAALATSAEAQVIKRGAVTVYKVDQASQASTSTIDFVNAKEFPLPQAPESASVAAQQDLMNNLANRYQSSAPTASGQALGSVGNGQTNPVELETPAVAPETMEDQGFESQQFGTLNHPFSTARADLNVPTNTRSPYRASGKLFFNIPGQGTFVCSASLIKRGVIVTAAHCVAEYGQSQFYSNWIFVPGYRNGVAPFGTWVGSSATLMTSYYAGAVGECHPSAPGVICKNDVALIELVAQASPVYPGTSTGWYGYGWNNWGFTSSLLTHITQTGYPVALDGGLLMQRNDSQGFRSTTLVNNTIIGSLMTGGSSGGPWLNNFGYKPLLNGTTFGSFSTPNTVVGVTSWGYNSGLPKEQGASPFTSTNIVPLVNAVCGNPVTDPRCL